MKRIGLILSGGMGKGAYQVGALTALSKFFEPSDFKYVSSASVGALNTYAFLTNQLDHARDIWTSVNTNGDKRFITSVLKSSMIPNIISELACDYIIPNNFYVPLLDLANRELRYYNFSNVSSEEIVSYLTASVAMPCYNPGVNIGSKVLYDGALIDNIPVYPILDKAFDYIICIYFDEFNYVFEDHSIDSKIIKLTFPDKKLISNSVNISHDSIMTMLNDGYNRTYEVLSKIFENGTSDLPFIYEKIQEHNQTTGKPRVRITGDVVVTNMNRVTKRMVRTRQVVENIS